MTAAESIWTEDLSSQTKDFVVKLLDAKPGDENELVPVMETLPMPQRQLASLYLLARFFEGNIQRWMLTERRRMLDQFDLRQRQKVKPLPLSDPRLHVHIGRDEDCEICKRSS